MAQLESWPVYLIDDEAVTRTALEYYLREAGAVVHVYKSAVEFMARLPALDSGCIVTDICMPDMDGLELHQKLKAEGLKIPLICVTGHADVPMAIKALRGGVFDFLEKPVQRETLVATVHRAFEASGKRLHAEAAAAEIEERLNSLTPRERQVLEALVAGATNKGIGRDLGMSPRTVENHRARIMLKMKARTLSELIRLVLTVMQNTS
jgi:two-component system response regulator FixJ